MSAEETPAERARREAIARIPRPRPPRPGGYQPVLDQTLAVVYARALRGPQPPAR